MTKKQIAAIKANAYVYGYHAEENNGKYMEALKALHKLIEDLYTLTVITRKQADSIREEIVKSAVEGLNDYRTEHAA